MSLFYYIAPIILLTIAVVGTIMIGNSKENKEGNPAYEYNRKKGLTILTLFYVVAGIVGVLSLFVYII